MRALTVIIYWSVSIHELKSGMLISAMIISIIFTPNAKTFQAVGKLNNSCFEHVNAHYSGCKHVGSHILRLVVWGLLTAVAFS